MHRQLLENLARHAAKGAGGVRTGEGGGVTLPFNQIVCGDALEVMRGWSDESVQCVVTSPPYWGLRDYGVDGQMGLEKSPEDYVAGMVSVFREVRRVLREDGTLWLNIGDSYAAGGRGGGVDGPLGDKQRSNAGALLGPKKAPDGLKPKDLCLIPFRLALALQADGWWVRSDIIWAKPNPMPESVTDRPTRSHEYMFLLTKSARYYYNAAAIRTPRKYPSKRDGWPDWGTAAKDLVKRTEDIHERRYRDKQRGHSRRHDGFNDRWDSMTKEEQQEIGANCRDVWTIATHPYAEAHFATFPPKLVEPAILAGSKPGDVVCDPFMGSGTVAMVAKKSGRNFVGVELNPAYIEMAHRRLSAVSEVML